MAHELARNGTSAASSILLMLIHDGTSALAIEIIRYLNGDIGSPVW
jgi:hypothetical protein